MSEQALNVLGVAVVTCLSHKLHQPESLREKEKAENHVVIVF